MPIVEWNETYVTGNAMVDSQHQQLFKLVNELHQAIVGGKGQGVQGPTLKSLTQYAVQHFNTEEDLMQSKGYPGFPQHKPKHEKLVQQVKELLGQFENGQLVLPLTVSRFLSEWITQHIKAEDKKMIEWLESH